MTTQIRLSAQGNGFIDDPNGGIIGLQYNKEGDTMRCFCVNFTVFDLSNRTATNTFIRQIQRANGEWITIGSFSKTVSDQSGYVHIDLPNFGQMEFDPFEPYTEEEQELVDEGISVERTLKPNLCTEAQFFIDTLVKNKHGVSVDIATFIYTTIIRQESL